MKKYLEVETGTEITRDILKDVTHLELRTDNINDDILNILNEQVQLESLTLYCREGLTNLEFLRSLKNLIYLNIIIYNKNNNITFNILNELTNLKNIVFSTWKNDIHDSTNLFDFNKEQINKLKSLNKLEVQLLLSQKNINLQEFNKDITNELKNTKEVSYYDSKNKYSSFEKVENSYNTKTKTIKIYYYETIEDLRDGLIITFKNVSAKIIDEKRRYFSTCYTLVNEIKHFLHSIN